MQIDKLNTEQLEVAIQERDREMIIDFYATWCGPCVLLAKELEQARCLGCVSVIFDWQAVLMFHHGLQVWVSTVAMLFLL